MARRGAFARWPIQGNVLEALREGRLEVGEGTLFEPHVWLTAPGEARIRIGAGSFLNIGVMVAAQELVEIGDHCMFANGCFVTDGAHRFDDPDKPVPWQGFTTKGPTRVDDNVWCGANVVDHQRRDRGRALRDRRQQRGHEGPAGAHHRAGAPAKVLREIDYEDVLSRAGDDQVERAVGGGVVRGVGRAHVHRVGVDARWWPPRSRPLPVPPLDSSPIVPAYVQLAMLRWKMTV